MLNLSATGKERSSACLPFALRRRGIWSVATASDSVALGRGGMLLLVLPGFLGSETGHWCRPLEPCIALDRTYGGPGSPVRSPPGRTGSHEPGARILSTVARCFATASSLLRPKLMSTRQDAELVPRSHPSSVYVSQT
jgi:hypothetical protein